MDPISAAVRVLELAAQIAACRSVAESAALADELADEASDLHAWVTSGGFLPDGWAE